jgi:hypothetical protein
MGVIINACRVQVGKPERSRGRGEYDIKMDPTGILFEVLDRMQLAQYRIQWRALVITVMNLSG